MIDGQSYSVSKKEEKRPLHGYTTSHSSLCAPYGKGFNIIVFSFLLIAVCITGALIADVLYYKNVADIPNIALITSNKQCGAIGMKILQDGGSAVDAAVAVQLCLGVTMPHLTGIGGGGIMHVYKQGNSEDGTIINFKEAVPSNASLPVPGEWSFEKNTAKIGVPGMLRGLFNTHAKFGKLSWHQLIDPSIHLAEKGFSMSASLYDAVLQQQSFLHPTLQNLFVPNGVVSGVGEMIVWKTMAATLRIIANEGSDALYNGSLTTPLLQDVQEAGEMLTWEDLINYRVTMDAPSSIEFRNWRLYLPRLPIGGLAMSTTLKILEGIVDPSQEYSVAFLSHAVIQATKFALAAVTQLIEGLEENENILKKSEVFFSDTYLSNVRQQIARNDSSFLQGIPDVRSPATAVTLAYDYDRQVAVIISGLGSSFGSQIVTSSGIIMNDALMDMTYRYVKPDFNTTTLYSSSTMVPVIFINGNDDCDNIFAAGSGDFQMLIQLLLNLNYSAPVLTAAKVPRFKVFLQDLQGDVGFLENVSSPLEIAELENLGHKVFQSNQIVDSISIFKKEKLHLETFTDDKGGFRGVK